MSDYDLGNEVIDIAKSACSDKESHTYSRLCNTHGSNLSELNKTEETRLNFMRALGIRETLKVELYQGDRAVAYLNMGNIETATQHYDKALDYYQRAVEIYPTLGDVAAWKLGLVYMGIGRCHAAQLRYQDARRLYGQAEQLFVRTKGSDKHFMAQ
jgi:tetratricopeptide (TPR) repeat protein